MLILKITYSYFLSSWSSNTLWLILIIESVWSFFLTDSMLRVSGHKKYIVDRTVPTPLRTVIKARLLSDCVTHGKHQSVRTITISSWYVNVCSTCFFSLHPTILYSWLSLNGHLYKTDTSVKLTPRVGPGLSFPALFDSL